MSVPCCMYALKLFIDVNLRFDYGSIRGRNNGLFLAGPIVRKCIGRGAYCWPRAFVSFALTCSKALRAPGRPASAAACASLPSVISERPLSGTKTIGDELHILNAMFELCRFLVACMR